MPGMSEDQHEGRRWNPVGKRAEQEESSWGPSGVGLSRLLSGGFLSFPLWMKWEPWDDFEQN